MPSAEWLELVDWERDGKPVLPGLRVKCNSFHNDPYLCSCVGKGYQPVPENLETLIVALQAAGIRGILYWNGVKFLAVVGRPRDENSVSAADTPLGTLMAAALKMKREARWGG